MHVNTKKCLMLYICSYYNVFTWPLYASALGSTQPSPFPVMQTMKKILVRSFNPLVTISHLCRRNGICRMTSDLWGFKGLWRHFQTHRKGISWKALILFTNQTVSTSYTNNPCCDIIYFILALNNNDRKRKMSRQY